MSGHASLSRTKRWRDAWLEFFTEAYENHMEETLQGALTANTSTSIKAPEPPQVGEKLMGKWDYCQTHCLCQHSSATCRAPAPQHKHNATLDQPMGGSLFIQFPSQGPRRPYDRQCKQEKTVTSGETTATASQATHVSSITEE